MIGFAYLHDYERAGERDSDRARHQMCPGCGARRMDCICPRWYSPTLWWLIALVAAALVFWGLRPAHGASVDACEIACGPVFTQCLIDAGTSAETPDPRIERECRRWTERECIRPCRRGR